MRSPDPLGAVRIAFGIDMQDDARDLPPVGARGLGVEEPQVSDEVLLIVAG